MSISLESISNSKRIRAPRIVLLGTSGIGKSEFCSESESPIFVPVEGEEGIDALDVKSFPVIKSYDEVMEAIGALYSGDHPHQTLVLDSVSALAPMVDAAAMQKENVATKALLGGGYGRQWDTIKALWTDLLSGVDALRDEKGIATVLIGHVKIKSSREPETESFDQWVFDVDSQVSELLIRWSDATLFMNSKTTITKKDGGFGKKEKIALDITGGTRYLFTGRSPTYPAKTRGCFGDIPAEIALPRHGAWGVFMGEVSKAITK